ncbi:phosphonate metabolism transcriptional regulator PhnF [filamentous cyanobacterium CCP5]|nr:phosphonate metabolism transcriptional regulator PhnF [filamentous cyanobacterium CCP5]
MASGRRAGSSSRRPWSASPAHQGAVTIGLGRRIGNVLPSVLEVSEAAPLYLQIASELRRNIQNAVYRVGDRLPTESELSARFGVNRHTLRRAVELLRHEGLIRVDRGRGTFVAAAPISYAIGRRVRYNQSFKAQGYRSQTQRLRIAEIPADDGLANQLQIAAGEPVILLERLGRVDAMPISLSSSYFPSNLFPGLLAHCDRYDSISQMLEQEYGCDHMRYRTRISAHIVDSRDARLLDLPLNAPILKTEAINVNPQGQVIEYGVTRFRGDRMELVFENDLSADCS